ncbi:hypothetical protein HO173_011019 [Letharia columbiana]|uniref:Rhodopsin domain-containing protein n=1 Tax=Letharia columbiana TaxID=112416 RepID=A0A8H6L074_9LECA|nr:uncharacterized protein HO173_011019 [Letharia columbiana]KAF6230668.1 hypothetical protein HO173_011019 [Letharia columbiana]
MEANQSIEGAVSPSPNYVSDGIVPVSAVFLTLSTFFLALRVYTRVRLLNAFYSEDYILVTAWLFSTAWTIICLEQEEDETRRHLWAIPKEALIVSSKWAAASIFLYVPATALPKLAILVSYLRILPNKNIRISVYAVFFITIGYMVASCLAFLLQCHPVARIWDMVIPGECHVISNFLVNGVFNFAIDIMVLLLPVPVLMEWRVSSRMRALMGSVFAIGSLACIVSAVRIYFIARGLNTFRTGIAVIIGIPRSLGVVETNLSIICGCIMVMRPFLRRHLPFLLEIGSQRVEHKHAGVIDDEQPLKVFSITVESRLMKTGAGFGGVNSSAGWIWDHRSRIGTRAIVDTATQDLDMEGARDWPLRHDLSPKAERADNVIEEIYYASNDPELARKTQTTRTFSRGPK